MLLKEWYAVVIIRMIRSFFIGNPCRLLCPVHGKDRLPSALMDHSYICIEMTESVRLVE